MLPNKVILVLPSPHHARKGWFVEIQEVVCLVELLFIGAMAAFNEAVMLGCTGTGELVLNVLVEEVLCERMNSPYFVVSLLVAANV